jgi:hypothetical protein
MRAPNDSKTMDMFPPEVKVRAVTTSASKLEAKRIREEREAARREARRWVVVFHPGTEGQEIGPRFSTYAEALRVGSIGGERFDVMFRDADGNLTTEF